MIASAVFYDPTPKGNYQRRGKLTDAQVVKIRLEYARAYKSTYRLAAEHGLTPASILAVVQGSFYKAAGGLITWPGEREITPAGKNRGHCWDVACNNPIAASGWAQRMHMCESCFRINGGRSCGRAATGKMRSVTCPCGQVVRFYATKGRHHPKYCSHACAVLGSAQARMKRPDDLTDDKLYELYWGQGLTLRGIAKRLGAVSSDAVRLWILAAKIQLRPKRRMRLTRCLIDSCLEPIHEKRAWYGRGYGRRCREHQREHDRRRRHFYEHQVQEAAASDLAAMVRRLVVGLPDAVKADAESEIMIAALSGELALPPTRDAVKPYIAKVFRDNADAWKFVSLAAPTRDGEDAQTWGERLGIA